MDSLRYWVLEMHVDGFRFDLARALARELHDVDRLGAFFDIIHQDPVISQVKLIAEPWDLGEGGYQVGNFPVLLGRVERQVPRHRAPLLEGRRRARWARSAIASTGSSDLYEKGGRRPYASINFVTAHDGFTLHDLVSYNDKHNEANGEENRDGAQRQPELELRRRRARPTIPTILAPARTAEAQLPGHAAALAGRAHAVRPATRSAAPSSGNNNAYCQDNEISWFDWRLDNTRKDLLAFTRHLIALRRRPPGVPAATVLRRAAHPGIRGQGPLLVPAGRQGDDRGELAGSPRALPRAAAGRRRHRGGGRSRRTGSRTTRS